jgi:Bacterial PH domain
VDEKFDYYPPYSLGLIFHITLIALLIFAGFWSLWQASNAAIGPLFLLYLLPGCVALVGVPILGYRAYALWRAAYMVEIGGIRLRWGLREEDIPMDTVQWVRLAEEMDPSLPLPFLRWPGAVLGTQRLPDGTQVEYLAASAKELVMIGTPERVFAVSPSVSGEFLQTCKRMAEFASLASIPPRSAYPSFLIARVWAERPARALLITGLILTILLLVLVSLVIPSRQVVSLGYTLGATQAEGVPAVQLLLLPVISGFFYLAQMLLGLYFFRREAESVLAYLMWGSCVLTGILFLAALFFVLNAG